MKAFLNGWKIMKAQKISKAHFSKPSGQTNKNPEVISNERQALIAKADAVVRARKRVYAESRNGLATIEPPNGILAGFSR